ncbi:hypothetical protein B0H10DRAFT_2202986 [Mycena sp. CBHHK59/15]|nr:hypothetical protein B0H10DRAFT_2202986 [Mycena sp. CBHHK59/15]
MLLFRRIIGDNHVRKESQSFLQFDMLGVAETGLRIRTYVRNIPGNPKSSACLSAEPTLVILLTTTSKQNVQHHMSASACLQVDVMNNSEFKKLLGGRDVVPTSACLACSNSEEIIDSDDVSQALHLEWLQNIIYKAVVTLKLFCLIFRGSPSRMVVLTEIEAVIVAPQTCYCADTCLKYFDLIFGVPVSGEVLVSIFASPELFHSSSGQDEVEVSRASRAPERGFSVQPRGKQPTTTVGMHPELLLSAAYKIGTRYIGIAPIQTGHTYVALWPYRKV